MSNYDASTDSILDFANNNIDAGTDARLGEGILRGGSIQTANEEFILDVTGDVSPAESRSRQADSRKA